METSRRKYTIPAVVGIGCLGLLIVVFALLLLFVVIRGSGSKVALIHVTGVITSGRSEGGLFSGASAGSERIVRLLEKARQDDDVKAVVLRINSPGGSPAGSEEVYNEINRLRRDGKKVFVSMGDLAASGGYYIASAADKIYADAATLTGSIGVIYENPEMSKLLNNVGVNLNVVKTGKFKDIGNPARPMTADERALIQSMIMDTYSQFISAVSRGRKMPEAKVKSLADGRVFTGRAAKKLGLIDEIGGLRETILAAGKAAGIKGEPKVKEYETGGLASAIFGSDDESSMLRVPDMFKLRFLKPLGGFESSQQGLR